MTSHSRLLKSAARDCYATVKRREADRDIADPPMRLLNANATGQFRQLNLVDPGFADSLARPFNANATRNLS